MADSAASEREIDAIIDEAALRLARGESVEAILRSHPEHASGLAGPLAALKSVLALPQATPTPQAEAAAMRRMLSELGAANERRQAPARAWPWGRHLRFQALAAGAAVLLFGGIGLASAAGDRGPVSLPHFLRLSSSDSIEMVNLDGTIVGVSANALALRTAAGDQGIVLSARVAVVGQGVQLKLSDLAPGQHVSVRAGRARDGSLTATRIDVIPAATTEDNATPTGPSAAGDGSPTTGGGAPAPEAIEPVTAPGGSDDGDNDTPDTSSDDVRTPVAGWNESPDDADGAGANDRTVTVTPAADDDEDANGTPTPEADDEALKTPQTSKTSEPTEHPESTHAPQPIEPPEH